MWKIWRQIIIRSMCRVLYILSYGSDVTISNNEYGFQIDQSAELVQLLADIGSGSPVTRDPVYSISGMKRNGKDDLAGSYIEVSLDSQAPLAV